VDFTKRYPYRPRPKEEFAGMRETTAKIFGKLVIFFRGDADADCEF
jgi:hypothetical protein